MWQKGLAAESKRLGLAATILAFICCPAHAQSSPPQDVYISKISETRLLNGSNLVPGSKYYVVFEVGNNGPANGTAQNITGMINFGFGNSRPNNVACRYVGSNPVIGSYSKAAGRFTFKDFGSKPKGWKVRIGCAVDAVRCPSFLYQAVIMADNEGFGANNQQSMSYTVAGGACPP